MFGISSINSIINAWTSVGGNLRIMRCLGPEPLPTRSVTPAGHSLVSRCGLFYGKVSSLVEDVGFSVGWRNNKLEKYWCFFLEAWQPISSQCWPQQFHWKTSTKGDFPCFDMVLREEVYEGMDITITKQQITHTHNVFSSIFCPLTTETSLTIFLALVIFLQPCGSVCDDSIFPKESIGEGTTPWWSLERDLVRRHGRFPFKRNNYLYLMSIQD